MATNPPVTTQIGEERLPVVVNVPDPMRYFASDSAAVRLLALLVQKIPAVSVLLYGAYHWLR
jgi:hypothetical protein